MAIIGFRKRRFRATPGFTNSKTYYNARYYGARASGAALGYIAGNIPGAVAGYYAGGYAAGKYKPKGQYSSNRRVGRRKHQRK